MNNANPMNMLMSMLQQGRANPQAFTQQLLANNPMLANELRGKNPKEFALQIMQQRGIDPTPIVNMVDGMKH
jgi:hypothetical protein